MAFWKLCVLGNASKESYTRRIDNNSEHQGRYKAIIESTIAEAVKIAADRDDGDDSSDDISRLCSNEILTLPKRRLLSGTKQRVSTRQHGWAN